MDPIKIYIRWDMCADSWVGRPHILSIHQTLEGADAMIPENIRGMERPVTEDSVYVKNYTYEAIEEREIGE